jgi:hypothetical protein
MSDFLNWTNLLPQYQSPEQMAQQNANTANINASTGLIGAQTGLVGAQTTGADIQNQGALTQYQMLQQALRGGMPDASAVPGATPLAGTVAPSSKATPAGGIAPGASGLPQGATPGPGGAAANAASAASGLPASGTPPGSGAASSSGGGHPDNYPSPDEMQAYTQQHLGALPVQFTQQEQQWMQQMRSSGNPILAARADAFQNGRVQATQQENAQRQYAAQTAYANASSVVEAGKDGAGFNMLMRLSPDLAKGVAASHPDDFATDSLGNVVAKPQGEADVVAYAKSGAAASYPHTGRESSMVNGQLIDTKSGKPVPGVDQVLTGLTADERQKAWDAATAPTTIKNSDGTESQVPAYKASGMLGGPQFNTPWDYVAAADKAARMPTNTSGGASTGIPGSATGSSSPSSMPRMISPAPQSQPPTAGAGSAPAAPPRGGTGTPPPAPASTPVDPVLKQALADPDYKIQAPKVQSGVSQSPAQAEQAKATVQARTDLLKDSQDATSAAAQSLQYLQAAKSIMDSKGATVGAYGGLINQASKWLPFTGNKDATNYAEIAKYLGNAALSNAKATYGAKMTQSEVGLQLNELSPSVKMPDKAISNLLDTNIKSAQYTIDSARRTRPYLASGGDPQSYADWNQKYYPREKLINGNTQSSSQGPQAQADSGGFVPGKVYRDKTTGTTATYQGNGTWANHTPSAPPPAPASAGANNSNVPLSQRVPQMLPDGSAGYPQ